MPTKKQSCERVHQAIAGPAPDQILEAIRAEYWLPTSPPQPASRQPGEDTARPDQAIEPKTSTQVKP